MTVDDCTTRYKAILEMNATKVEKEKLVSWLILDLEKVFHLSLYESQESEQKNEELYTLYRRILTDFS